MAGAGFSLFFVLTSSISFALPPGCEDQVAELRRSVLPKPNLDRFLAGKRHARAAMNGARAPQPVRSTEHKIAAVVVALEQTLGVELELGQAELNQMGFSLPLKLTEAKVRELIESILAHADFSSDRVTFRFPQGFWSHWPFAVGATANRAELHGFFRTPAFRQFIDRMVVAGLVKKPGLRQALVRARHRHQMKVEVAKALVGNSVLVLLGIPPVYVSDIKPIETRTSGALRNIVTGQTAPAIGRRWTHGAIRGARRALLVTGVFLAVLYYQEITGIISSTTVRMQTWLLPDAVAAEVEDHTYDPAAVIAEQMEVWEADLDYVPTAAQRAAKRADFVEQEKAGVLRVYKGQRR